MAPSLSAEPVFFFFLIEGKRRLSLSESHQAFEVATARTSGLVNLVFSREKDFSNASIRLLINPGQ